MNDRIKQIALEAGYDLVGVAPLEIPERDAGNLREFTARGLHGDMGWFKERLELRLNPGKIFPEAKSALVLGSMYRDPDMEAVIERGPLRISRYALGRDYHRFLRKKGKKLLQGIRAIAPGANGRITVDSAPVPEKILAGMAGLGWRGKHTNLIHPELGSYFFISVLFLTLELERDQPLEDRCGQCRLCIDACPTDALRPYEIDARKCISYLTIETKTPLPPEYRERTEGWIFGCDICQEVCPYNQPVRTVNRFARTDDFRARPGVRDFLRGLNESPGGDISADYPDEETWEEIKTGSAMGRVAREKIADSIRAARKRES